MIFIIIYLVPLGICIWRSLVLLQTKMLLSFDILFQLSVLTACCDRCVGVSTFIYKKFFVMRKGMSAPIHIHAEYDE